MCTNKRTALVILCFASQLLLLCHGPVQNLGQRSTTADWLGLYPAGFIISPRMESPQLLWAEVCDHLDSIKCFSYIMNIGNISLRHFSFRSQLSQLTIVCQMILIVVVGLCWIALVCPCLVLESPALTDSALQVWLQQC